MVAVSLGGSHKVAVCPRMILHVVFSILSMFLCGSNMPTSGVNITPGKEQELRRYKYTYVLYGQVCQYHHY